MRYRAFQAQADLLAPARLAAGWANMALDLAPPWVRQIPPLAQASAGWQMLTRAGLTHHRRDYGFRSVRVGTEDVPVTEETVVGDAFGDLVRFRKETNPEQPRILLVAPLSGHFATLLRGTVETLLPENDVYITDWRNARDAPLADGAFGFDDYVAHIIAYLEAIGGLGVVVGAYANAGGVDEGIGWADGARDGPAIYAALARTWLDAGATIVGGCCGTGPAHISGLAARLAALAAADAKRSG